MRFHRRECIILITLLAYASGAVNAQSAGGATLTIAGDLLKPLTLSIDDLAKLPRITLKATDRDNKEHEYTGVAVTEVLKAAGVTLGSQLRGDALTRYVVMKAADNYQVVYALPELDPEFTDDVVLLAITVDGKPLPKGEGPFRIVNPSDKKHARWIREIRNITIQNAKE